MIATTGPAAAPAIHALLLFVAGCGRIVGVLEDAGAEVVTIVLALVVLIKVKLDGSTPNMVGQHPMYESGLLSLTSLRIEAVMHSCLGPHRDEL